MISITTLGLILMLVCSSTPTCFLPNGTALTEPQLRPCSTDRTNPLRSTCCHTGWDNPPGGDLKMGPSADECLPNGLCQNRGQSTITGAEQPPWTHFYRVYCTNQDWSGCLNVCNTGLVSGDVAQLTSCDGTPNSETWCCGNSTDCCASSDRSKLITIPQQLGSATEMSAAARSSVSSASKTAIQVERKKWHKIVICLGVGIGALILLCVAIGLIWYYRSRIVNIEMGEGDRASQRIGHESDATESRTVFIRQATTHG